MLIHSCLINRFIGEWRGGGAGIPGWWDSQPGSISLLPPAHLETHILLRSQTHAMMRHSFVLSRSPNHRRGGDYRAPPVLMLDLQLLTHFWLTHLWRRPNVWPTSHRTPPQTSFPVDLHCALEFLQPGGTSTACSGQLHPAQPSPGCCPGLHPLLPPQPKSSGSGCSDPEMCLPYLGLFNSCSRWSNFSPSDLLIPPKCKSVHIRLLPKHLPWVPFFSRIKPKPCRLGVPSWGRIYPSRFSSARWVPGEWGCLSSALRVPNIWP